MICAKLNFEPQTYWDPPTNRSQVLSGKQIQNGGYTGLLLFIDVYNNALVLSSVLCCFAHSPVNERRNTERDVKRLEDSQANTALPNIKRQFYIFPREKSAKLANACVNSLGRDSRMKRTGILVVSFRDVNFGF